jgi:hypothetical protein
VEIRGDVKPMKRSVARGDAVDRHHEFILRNVNEEVAFMGVVKMARQFDGFASERDRLRRLECHIRQQSVGIIHFFEEVGDTFERDDLEAFNVLERCRTADVIFVDVRIDEHLDWLARDLGDGGRNIFSESGWCVEYDHSVIGNKKSGLPHVVGDNVNAPAYVLDRIAEGRVDLPKFRLNRRQDRNVRVAFGR